MGLDLFAKNVKTNFVLMLTFSNFKKKPNIIKTLKEEDSFFKDIISDLNEPFYFQFENGSLFSKEGEDDDILDKINFNRSMENMKKFLENKLTKLESISIIDSYNVCKERLLQKEICQIIIIKRKELIKQKKLIEKNKKKILESKEKIIKDKNFKMEIDEYITEKEYLGERINNTVCIECKENCHENCRDTRIFSRDLFKYFCICINKLGFCKICNKKCYMSHHKYVNYKYVKKTITHLLTIDEIYQNNIKNISENDIKEIDKINLIITNKTEKIKQIEKDLEENYSKLTTCLF